MAASHASRHGNTAFSSAKAAGAALERRPSRPLSLPRSTPGARPCARGAPLRTLFSEPGWKALLQRLAALLEEAK